MLSAAGSEFVDLRREQLLSCSGLPEQEDRGVGGCHLLDLLHDPAHRCALPDNASQSKPFALFPSKVNVFRLQLILQALHFQRRRPHGLVTQLPRQDLVEHAADNLEALHYLRRPGSFGADCVESNRARHPPFNG